MTEGWLDTELRDMLVKKGFSPAEIDKMLPDLLAELNARHVTPDEIVITRRRRKLRQ